MAAARKVSAAHSTTALPSFLRRFASFPMLVVFPVPLTPTTRITSGPPSTELGGREFAFVRIASSSSFSNRLSSFTSPICFRSALSRNFSRTSCVVVIPRSAAISVASSSSRVLRSICLLKETISSMRSLRFSRVRVTASFIRSKKPGFFCSGSFSALPKRDLSIRGRSYRHNLPAVILDYSERVALDLRRRRRAARSCCLCHLLAADGSCAMQAESAAFEYRSQCFDHPGIELRGRQRVNDAHHVLGIHRSLVRTIRRHRIERVGHHDHAG